LATAFVTQVEHLQVQLATSHDHGPANPHPARIDGARVEQAADGRLVVFQTVVVVDLDLLVDGLIEHGDDAVLGQEGIGDVNLAAGVVHEIADGASDGRFAVAGRTVDEHRLAADDGGTDGVEQLIGNDQVRERGPQRLGLQVIPVTDWR